MPTTILGLRLSNLLPAEMCPQIRQRSVEEAFMHAIPTNNACTISPIKSIISDIIISNGSLKNKATNQVNKSSSKLKKSTKSKSKQLNKSNKRSEKRRDRKPSLNSASSSPLVSSTKISH
ncbi:unnamed protein product [Trichobilharzia regenti]|nr:unnamed protein product [Trichobilharzia regenti]